MTSLFSFMGLGESKEFNEELELFSVEEKAILRANFASLSGNSKKTDRHSVENKIKETFPIPSIHSLAKRLCDLMTGQIATNNTVTFDGYIHCAAIMMKGMLEDQANQFVYLAKLNTGAATRDECLGLTIQLIQISFQIIRKLPAFRSWDGNYICGLEEDSIRRLASALVNELSNENSSKGASFDKQAVCAWLSKSSLLYELFNMLARQLFHFPMSRGKNLIPLCRGLPTQVYPSWLALSDIVFINSSLPNQLRTEWRFLFSSRIHGESFSSLMGNIVDRGPSLVFVKDLDGHIFGGFASTSWTIAPQFKGTSENFVFSLAPNMAVYNTTGYNDHYQYLNIQQQTFPNGMGMGGQLDYFGIWIDSEYGKGKCSPSCTTYGCPQLSGKPEFAIDMMEVWAVGPEAVEDEAEEKGTTSRSVLDTNREGRAMLDIIGKERHSEGFREPAIEED